MDSIACCVLSLSSNLVESLVDLDLMAWNPDAFEASRSLGSKGHLADRLQADPLFVLATSFWMMVCFRTTTFDLGDRLFQYNHPIFRQVVISWGSVLTGTQIFVSCACLLLAV